VARAERADVLGHLQEAADVDHGRSGLLARSPF
jgi:hypothetical protein